MTVKLLLFVILPLEKYDFVKTPENQTLTCTYIPASKTNFKKLLKPVDNWFSHYFSLSFICITNQQTGKNIRVGFFFVTYCACYTKYLAINLTSDNIQKRNTFGGRSKTRS